MQNAISYLHYWLLLITIYRLHKANTLKITALSTILKIQFFQILPLVKSYDRLSHDCTSEPECEENCVIVERNECDIVEETECFTTNQKNCEITQEETCQTVTEEECSETFAQQCSTVEVGDKR